jgi:hypothetical protein
MEVFFSVHDQFEPYHTFFIFANPFAYLYDAYAFSLLYDQIYM